MSSHVRILPVGMLSDGMPGCGFVRFPIGLFVPEFSVSLYILDTSPLLNMGLVRKLSLIFYK